MQCKEIAGIEGRVSRNKLTVDPITQHHTNCDHDLEQTRYTSTDLFGRALGDECRRNSGYRTNADTSDDAAAVDEAEASRASSDSLQDLN